MFLAAGLLLVSSVLLLIIYYLTKDFYFFKKKGIPYERPLPILGNQWRLFLRSKSAFVYYDRYYQLAKKNGLGGIFQMIRPGYVIADPELIKNITIKDFDHFVNHIKFSNGDLFSKTLFFMEDSKWRDARATLSPAFTGTKMRIMFELLEKCSINLHKRLLKESASAKDGVIKTEIKRLMTRFTNDAIATSAFGIEVDSINEDENEFYWMARDLTDFRSGFRWLRIFLIFISPRIVNLIWKEGIFAAKPVKFFRKIFTENVKARRDQNIFRPDMIHLMLEATREEREKRKRSVLDDEEMLAQTLIFIIGGLDTIATSTTFVMHHLAENPDVQDKLYQEISETLKQTNGRVNYEELKSMNYLKMVLKESQRMLPVITFLQRECNKKYTIPAKGERPEVTINPGEMVLMFPWSFHHDTEYFPEPEKFMPERFSEENNSKINPYAFMPFGIGPRICIANRFAQMEVKLVLVHILKSFELIFIKETDHPMKLSPFGTGVAAVNGFWLGLKPRSQVMSK